MQAAVAAALPERVERAMALLRADATTEAVRLRTGMAAPPDNAPQQRHLSLTGDVTQMAVTWVLLNDNEAPCTDAHATLLPGGAVFAATEQTYDVGGLLFSSWNGTIYTAIMTGLTPSATYSYSVTACGATSNVTAFKAAPKPSATAVTRVAVLADMGTVIPLGFAVAEQLAKEHAAAPFDYTLLAGA